MSNEDPGAADPAGPPEPTASTSWVLVGAAAVAIAAFVAYFALCICKLGWTGDFRVYVAGVRELYEHPFAPRHETLALPASTSFAYTPYLYLAAGLGALLRLGPYGAMQAAALVNLGLYTSGLLALFSRRWWGGGRNFVVVTAAFLLATLFVRNITYFLSSEVSADSWGYVVAYPSAFAWGLFLWTLVALERVLELSERGTSARLRWLLLVALGVWTTLVVHPLTGSWLFGIAGLRALLVIAAPAFVRTPATRAQRRSAVVVVVVVVMAAALTPLWPWLSFLQKGIVTAREGTALTEAPFATFAALYVLAGLALVRRTVAGDGRVAWLLLGWGASGVVYVVLGFADIDYRARYIFFMGFFAQVLVAWQLSTDLGVLAALGRREGRRLAGAGALVGVVAVAVAVGLQLPVVEGRLASPQLLWSKSDAAAAYAADLEPLQPYLDSKSIVLFADPRSAMRLTAATGARSVFVTFAAHLEDNAQRRADVPRFFGRSTSKASRAQIIDRWQATHALIARPTDEKVQDLAAVLGPPLFRNRNLALFSTERLAKKKPEQAKGKKKRSNPIEVQLRSGSK